MSPTDDSDADSQREVARDLAEAALRRGGDRIDLARAAFRRAFPEAPDQMIDAAVFHVFVDGIAAAMEWLADTERFLRDSSHRLCSGTSAHLIYHLYNWHQLEALMPHGKSGLLEFLDDISHYASERDFDSIEETVQNVKNLLSGEETPPDFI